MSTISRWCTTFVARRASLARARWSMTTWRDVVGLRSEVIHHWVDTDRFHPRPAAESRRAVGLPSTGRYLLNVTGAGPNKNLTTLARVAAHLPAGWKLVRIGPPLTAPNCLNMGSVSRELYPLFYTAADAYLHTSVTEGFGIPLIESMGSATPVISSRSSTGPEVLGDAGIYVDDPKEVSGFVAAVATLEDDRVRSEAAARCHLRAKEFAPAVARTAYGRFYERAFELDIMRSPR